MPLSIIMQECISFPEEFPLETKEFGTGDGNTFFKSEVRELGISEYTEDRIEKYQVIHPIGDTFEGKGYLEDGTQHDIVAVSTSETFNIYKTQDNYLFFTNSRKPIIEHGIKRLTDGTYHYGEGKKFKSKQLKLDLSSLKEELEDGALAQIKGGWWRDLQIADVEVAYLGGGTVTESQNWGDYEDSQGIISALRLDIPNPMDSEDEVLKILLTKEGNLVVYKNIPTEKDLLEISTTIFDIAKEHIVS